MRTKSKRARLCPVCGGAMRRNGRTRAGSQRWKCVACSLGATVPRPDERLDADLRVFLGWLLSGRRQADMGTGSRMFRKRGQWCWGIRPEIPPCSARHHTVMADGTYMNHDWCLIVAIDGESGEVLGIQWCSNESKAAYMALFSRIPAPDVLITDGLRVFCQVVIGQCGVSFPSEKAVGFSPVRNWPVIARVLLFHCIRA